MLIFRKFGFVSGATPNPKSQKDKSACYMCYTYTLLELLFFNEFRIIRKLKKKKKLINPVVMFHVFLKNCHCFVLSLFDLSPYIQTMIFLISSVLYKVFPNSRGDNILIRHAFITGTFTEVGGWHPHSHATSKISYQSC